MTWLKQNWFKILGGLFFAFFAWILLLIISLSPLSPAYILAWISLVLVSFSLIFLSRWVEKKAMTYALIGLVFIEVTLIVVLGTLK